MSEDYPLMAFIANQGVAPKGERYDRSALVNDEVGKKYKRTEFGDFIYSSNNLESGSIGLNKYGNACISPVYSIFKPIGNADLNFLGRRFLRKDFINEMIKWRQGVVYGQWKIHESDFSKIQIEVPNTDEQKKMGEYFDRLDRLITLHQRKYRNLQKKSLCAWEQRKFGDLGSVAMCKRIFKEQTAIDGDIPFYKIGTFGNEPDSFISKELFEEYKEKFQYPEVGDMLISASGTIGRTVEYTGEEAYFQDSNIVWFKHDERIDNLFLKCIYAIVQWSGIEGSTIKRLYNDNFLKTEFYMPSVFEQKQIGQYFSTLDYLITLHQRKLKILKNIKKSMLEKIFV